MNSFFCCYFLVLHFLFITLRWNLPLPLLLPVAALHQGFSKYLTVQDTHCSPTPTKHSRTMSSHGNLLSLQSQSTIQESKAFLCLVLIKFIQKLDVAQSWDQLNFQFLLSLSQTEKTQAFETWKFFFHGHKLYTGSFSANSSIIYYLKKKHFKLLISLFT